MLLDELEGDTAILVMNKTVDLPLIFRVENRLHYLWLCIVLENMQYFVT